MNHELIASAAGPLLGALRRRDPRAGRQADGAASVAFAVAAELGYEAGEALSLREAARLAPAVAEGGPAGAAPPAPQGSGAAATNAAATDRMLVGAGVPDETAGWVRSALADPEAHRSASDPPAVIAAAIAFERALRSPTAADAARAAGAIRATEPVARAMAASVARVAARLSG